MKTNFIEINLLLNKIGVGYLFDKDTDLESIVEKVDRISFLEKNWIEFFSFRSFPIKY